MTRSIVVFPAPLGPNSAVIGASSIVVSSASWNASRSRSMFRLSSVMSLIAIDGNRPIDDIHGKEDDEREDQ